MFIFHVYTNDLKNKYFCFVSEWFPNSQVNLNFLHSLRPFTPVSFPDTIEGAIHFIQMVQIIYAVSTKIDTKDYIFLDLQFQWSEWSAFEADVIPRTSARTSEPTQRGDGTGGDRLWNLPALRLANHQINAERDNESCHRTRSPGSLFNSDIRSNFTVTHFMLQSASGDQIGIDDFMASFGSYFRIQNDGEWQMRFQFSNTGKVRWISNCSNTSEWSNRLT